MNTIKHFIKLGTSEQYTENFNRGIRTFNVFQIIIVCVGVFYSIVNIYIQQYILVLPDLALIVLATINLDLNRRKKYELAQTITAYAYFIVVTVLALLANEASFTKIYLILTATSCALLLELRPFLLMMVLHALVMQGITMVHEYYPDGLSGQAYHPFISYLNTMTVLFSIAGIVHFTWTQLYDTYVVVDNRNEEIQKLNIELEEKVLQRTRELQRSNTQLRNANQEIQRFAHISSHDMRESLRTVTSFNDLLQRDIRAKQYDNLGEYAELTNWGVKKLSRLLDDVWKYSFLTAESIAFEAVDTNALAQQLCEKMEQEVGHTAFQWSVSKLPVCVASANLLQMLLEQLIDNAWQYRKTDQPLALSIDATESKAYWQFRVSDNGIGIESEYTEQIFDLFTRLHNTKGNPSSGIGLAICKKIANLHSGKIWVESHPGVGSQFFFTLSKHLTVE